MLSPARSHGGVPAAPPAHPRATILAVSINFQKEAGGFFTPARSPMVVFLLWAALSRCPAQSRNRTLVTGNAKTTSCVGRA